MQKQIPLFPENFLQSQPHPLLVRILKVIKYLFEKHINELPPQIKNAVNSLEATNDTLSQLKALPAGVQYQLFSYYFQHIENVLLLSEITGVANFDLEGFKTDLNSWVQSPPSNTNPLEVLLEYSQNKSGRQISLKDVMSDYYLARNIIRRASAVTLRKVLHHFKSQHDWFDYVKEWNKVSTSNLNKITTSLFKELQGEFRLIGANELVRLRAQALVGSRVLSSLISQLRKWENQPILRRDLSRLHNLPHESFTRINNPNAPMFSYEGVMICPATGSSRKFLNELVADFSFRVQLEHGSYRLQLKYALES